PISLESQGLNAGGDGKEGPQNVLVDEKAKDPLQKLVEDEEVQEMHRKAAGLDQKYRDLYAQLCEDRSVAEIAEMTGQTVPAVNGKRTRLLKKMRTKLSPDHDT